MPVLPLEIAGLDKKAAQRTSACHYYKSSAWLGQKITIQMKLSGGMKQRVAFLRAVLSGNPLLLLDEPFSALDAITKLSMQEWLIDQWEKTTSQLCFSSHMM